MLLIDTMYINDGGGKVLLDYLITNLEDSGTECFYLLDARIKNNHPVIKPSNRVVYVKPGLLGRFLFYRKYKTDFSKIFCMGNLPPNIQTDAEVITYYHSPLYLENPVDFPIKERIKYALKRRVLRKFIKNSNLWWVQTELIKEKFQEKFDIETSKVGLMPFYPPFGPSKVKTVREKNSFLYVSNATVHKNHIRLIDAFCAFFDKYKTAKLTLTVSDSYREIVDLIERKISEGYPIVNVGFIGREELQMLYLSSEYLIFPSLAESFGLGLVEAIDNGCKVIGADLDYTYAVCEPSLVFNPYEVASISEALGRAIDEETGLSKSRMSNKINELVKLLQ